MKKEINKLKLKIHADDFGVSKGVTDNICSTFDDGILTSTSIIPNGKAFEYAINKYKNRKDLGLSIHINLVEGRPISNPNELNLIVSKKGNFNRSFIGLWVKYIFSTRRKRMLIIDQVKKEITAQIKRVISNINNDYKINLDSHLHFHMIPFIFKILCELNREYHFNYIRIPNEKLFFVRNQFFRNYFTLNLIKNVLLKFLSFNKKKILNQNEIKSNDYFLGVLFSGKMSKMNVFQGLKKINKTKNNLLIEILFHPGAQKREKKTFGLIKLVYNHSIFQNGEKKKETYLKIKIL